MNVKPDFFKGKNLAATAPAFLSVWDIHAGVLCCAADFFADSKSKWQFFTKTNAMLII